MRRHAGLDSCGTSWLTQFQIILPSLKFPSTWIFRVSVFQVSVIITPGPALVNSVTVSSDSYPAAPNFERPDFDSLHQGLLQPHLYIFKYKKRNTFRLPVSPRDPLTLLCWRKPLSLHRVSGLPVNHSM